MAKDRRCSAAKLWATTSLTIEEYRRARWEVVEQAYARVQQNTGAAGAVLLNRKNDVRCRIAAKDLRQQGNGIKRDGQTSSARDHRPVVERAVDPARDATRRDPVWWDRGFHFVSEQDRLRGSGSERPQAH